MSAEPEPTGEPIGELVLAREPDFRLGGLLVSPSSCSVQAGARRARLEPRVMQVLIVLARTPGRTVTRDELIEACWDGRIVSDDATSRIIAKLRTLAREFDPPHFQVETLPKVGFRLVLADADPPDAASERLPTVGGGRLRLQAPSWPIILLAAVLAAALAGVAVWRYGGGEAGQNGRIEVVRFETRGADPALPELAAGLGESLIRVMTTSGMRVAATPALPGAGASANDAELRVAGTVERLGGDYAVNVQVLDRKTGLVLLSVQEQRPANALPGFTEQAAFGVAGSLSCALEDRPWANRSMSAAVFALYLNTCDAITREGDLVRMVEAGRRLVRSAPDLATGQALYAISLALLGADTKHGSDDAEALRKEARAAAGRAIALNPKTPKAYLALALTYPDGGDWAEREAYLLKARAVDPNLNPGRMPYARLLRELGRLNEALEVARMAVEAKDPRIQGVQIPTAFLSAQAGDLDGAYALLAQFDHGDLAITRRPRFIIASWWEAPATALPHIRAYADGGPRSTVACLLAYLPRLEAGGVSVRRGLPPECDSEAPDSKIRLLAREGDVDGAYALLERSPPSASRTAGYMFYPEMKAFRRDPRFMYEARRAGLAAYWRKSGKWPDFCAEPGLPYDCQVEAAK